MSSRYRDRGFSSGGQIVSGDGFGRNDILWEVDFTRFPLSNGSNAGYHTTLLSSKGMTFTRSSTATVQTSPSTLVTSIAVDEPRVGNSIYGPGLVLEESRSNLLSYSTPGSLGDSNVSILTSSVVGPDGTTSYSLRHEDAEIGTIGYIVKPTPAYTIGAPYVGSYWYQDVSGNLGVPIGFNMNDSSIGTGPVSLTRPTNVSSSWTRRIHPYTGGTTGAGSSYVSIPAYVANAVGKTDFAFEQKEAGAFATEVIISNGAPATRQAETLTMTLSTLTRILRSGRIALEFRFIPKHNTANMNVTGNMLFSQPGLFTRAYLSAAGAMLMRHEGAAVITSSNTFTWNIGDILDVYIEIGGNIAPYAAIRKNQQTRTIFTFPAGTYGNVVSTTAPTLMSESGTVAPCSVWIQYIRAWAGRRPSWAV